MISYRQSFPNSCGAAALMCAAIELNRRTMPASALHVLWELPSEMPLLGNQASEIKIYSITSGVPVNVIPTNASGYSMPSRIGLAARVLGLNTIAFVPQSIIGAGLLLWKSSEPLEAQRNGMLVTRTNAPLPVGNQRLLKIMRVGDADSARPATGLHYVMLRPDQSVMDPAAGQNFPNLAIAIEAHGANGTFYADTGLAILIA